MVKVVEQWMGFLIGVFLFVGLRRSLGLVGTGGVGSDGRKSHDRGDSLTNRLSWCTVAGHSRCNGRSTPNNTTREKPGIHPVPGFFLGHDLGCDLGSHLPPGKTRVSLPE